MNSFSKLTASSLFLFMALVQSYFVSASVQSDDQPESAKPKSKSPNVVLIFIDDMGYNDIGPFGVKGIKTPNLDQMAKEGRRFTDFVVPSAVCSASRASLLTGCVHRRVGISGALGPHAKHGLHQREMTMAELCKQKNYATAIFGKWHLGHKKEFLPLQHGFDEYFGLPFSNDMWPYHPGVRKLPMEKRIKRWPHLPLIEGNKIVNAKVTPKDQEQLTTQYTEKACDFIRRNQKENFFLYVPHSMVHVPLYVSDKFKGKSGKGLFGDVVMEIDWSVGQIRKTLKDCGLEKDTLVVFTSDNGPWLSYGDHAGTTDLREGKGTMFEGGVREPTLMAWPGRIPANSHCSQFASTVDIFPTVAKLIGAKLPNHKIDGKDISGLLFDKGAQVSPHETFPYYYGGGQLQAIRNGRWKLFFPHQYRSMKGRKPGKDGIPGKYTQLRTKLELYDLQNDVNEKVNVKDQNPEIVKMLQEEADKWRADLGDKLRDIRGKGIRPAGKVK